MREEKKGFKYNLQYFAEPAQEIGAEATGAEAQGVQEPQSFDDILKDSRYQSEFDKKVAKALETAKSKWAAEYESKLEAEKTEAAKLAKLSADEKAKYETEKRLKELEARESELNRREMKAKAMDILQEKGLDRSFAEIVDLTDAEKCNASIETISKIFNDALEKKVADKLRGGEPPKKPTGTGATSYKSILENADNMTPQQVAEMLSKL